MKVFISYHRADTKYRDKVVTLLKKNGVEYYVVPKNVNYDGLHHQHIVDIINKNMNDCDVLICIVGKETFSRPHVDWELFYALKGGINLRKGILVIMLEERGDSKNKIDYDTFPNRLQDNLQYIVLEQFSSLKNRILGALDTAALNSRNISLAVSNNRSPMELRKGKYYTVN